MSVAAYRTSVKVGGIPVLTNDVLLEELGTSGKVYRIPDSSQRIISSDEEIIVEVDGNPVTPVAINYLDGIVYLSDSTVEDVTVTYYYVPVSFVGGSKEYNLEIGGDLLDVTAFHDDTEQNPGYHQRIHGLTDVSCSFSRFDDLTKTLRDAKMAKSKILIQIRPGGVESKQVATGWFINETVGASGDVSAAEEESFNYVLAGDMQTNFSFIQDYTLLEAAELTEEEILANYFIGLVE